MRFHVKKVDQRQAFEDAMQGVSPAKVVTYQRLEPDRLLFNPVRLSTTDYEKAKAAAPGWDVYHLEREWREWIEKKGRPDNPSAAFIAFCRKKYQRRARP